MRSAAARIHWSARGTSVTSSHAQKNPQKIDSIVASSLSSPAQTAARLSSRKVRPSSTRSVITSTPPRYDSASNSMSGSPSRRPTAIASRSSASRTCASGSVKAFVSSSQPCSGPSPPTSSRTARARASQPLRTAQSPRTLPVIQEAVVAARPAAMFWRSRR